MPASDFNALPELLTKLVLNWRLGVLLLLLWVAAVLDLRTQRIPNWLVLPGLVFGVACNIIVRPFPQAEFWWPLAGLAVGFAGFLPMYLLRAMGAGDVKLMAMVGAFMGPGQTLRILLYTLVIGGVLSLALVLLRGTTARLLRNISTLFQFAYLSALNGQRPQLSVAPDVSAGKLPYAMAIALGTLSYLVLHPLTFV